VPLRINLTFGCGLLAALGLIVFTGGVLEIVGYALVLVVAVLELALDRMTSGAHDSPTGGDYGLGGAGVREPLRPKPTHGAGHAALPVPLGEPDDPRTPDL
jgi:hypothetical protein